MTRIWIDLDNTPHIPFFRPIIDALRAKGYEVVLTARDAYQVCDLADRSGLAYARIGKHYGKNKLLKFLGTLFRSLQLVPFALRHRPALALSHGSRTQLLASWLLRIPSLMIYDYEFAKGLVAIHPTRVMVPDIIPDDKIPFPPRKVFKYPGLKEDVYVPFFRPGEDIRRALGVAPSGILVTVRPPATEAHYHNPKSEELFEATMEHLLADPRVKVVLLPRNRKQEESVRTRWPQAVAGGRVEIPAHALDGLDLMWASDLVVSGGGTMNREAAALGVPVYSIFRGTIGAVDRFLSQQGKLVLLEAPSDLPARVHLAPRPRDKGPDSAGNRTLDFILDAVTGMAGRPGGRGGDAR